MTLPSEVVRYLQRRAIEGPWRLQGCGDGLFSGAVVIPALAESRRLFATLESLAANPPDLLEQFLVVVVVNSRPDTPPPLRQNNRLTLERLAETRHAILPSLALVDATTPGRELPEREGGVGMARKIGFDLCLPLLDFKKGRPLLISLDADTLVRPDYLGAILTHFASADGGGAVIPFSHQRADNPPEQEAIDRYELFLRATVLGLELAGSPYAFHTIGSAMTFRAEAYVRAGGMNRRRAGEDFHFLQQVAKTSGVEQLRGTVVHPAARPSTRVPFGTGPAVASQLRGEALARFYPAETFRILGAWLQLAERSHALSGPRLCTEAGMLSPRLGVFLREAGLEQSWDRLRGNHPRPEALHRAFHGWFDGLRTIRCIHHLCGSPAGRQSDEEALPPLLALAGLPDPGTLEQRLALIRGIQQEGGVRPLREVLE